VIHGDDEVLTLLLRPHLRFIVGFIDHGQAGGGGSVPFGMAGFWDA
jgi:hypothetical protein